MGIRTQDATVGCKLCKRGFHTDCWTIFHRPLLFIEANPPVRKELITFLYHHLLSKDPFPVEDHNRSYALTYVPNSHSSEARGDCHCWQVIPQTKEEKGGTEEVKFVFNYL